MKNACAKPSQSLPPISTHRYKLKSELVETGMLIYIEPLPKVNAVYAHMKILFTELFQNALKFKKFEGSPVVRISCETKRGDHGKKQWLIRFEDNGIGIERGYENKIFLPFERLHSKKEYPGTGLGLALCKKIIECHGGKIAVETQQDKGTIVTMSFPCN